MQASALGATADELRASAGWVENYWRSAAGDSAATRLRELAFWYDGHAEQTKSAVAACDTAADNFRRAQRAIPTPVTLAQADQRLASARAAAVVDKRYLPVVVTLQAQQDDLRRQTLIGYTRYRTATETANLNGPPIHPPPGKGSVRALDVTQDEPPAPWPWDDDTVPGKPVPGSIPVNDETWRIIQQSPTLMDEWTRLKNGGWHFTFDRGKGTFTDSDRKVINIDPDVKKGDPTQVVNAISHEFGHAMYNPRTTFSSRADCIQAHLDDEGAATMNTIKVEREILAHGGPEIVQRSGVDEKFEAIYDAYLRAGSTKEAYQTAITAIGNEYGALHPSTAPGETYRDYYGKGCR